jgi:acetyl esterase/lipase
MAMHLNVALCTAALAAWLDLYASAAEPVVRQDVKYGLAENGRQALDLYAPGAGARHSIIFWIHGGGWQAGDKSQAGVKPKFFVEQGYLFVSTNYRLLPEATINEMAGDVAKALRWVHDHAAEFGGDPASFVVTGHSAGAQLAALLCTDERYLNAEGLSLAIIKGCAPVDGDTYDVPMQVATVDDRIANIYRKKFGDEAGQRALSPVTHVARGKPIPPFLILHVAEHLETKGQSRRLVNALVDAGVSASAYAAKGKDHVTLNDDLGQPNDEPTAAMLAFVNRVTAAKEGK